MVVLSLAAIPLGVLIGALRDPTLQRRSRFWLRFAGLVTCILLPWSVALVAAVGEQAAVTLMFLGLAWALLLVALAPFLLFHGTGSDPGPDHPGDDPGPEDDRPPPRAPIGGLPLPDAEQPSWRLRGPHQPRVGAHPRRPARERERRRTPL